MIKALGFIVLLILAAFGAYFLFSDDAKNFDKAKEKAVKIYKLGKKEWSK